MAKPIIEAHRGANAETPENTLAAFKRAIVLGAASIELDVRLSSDGTLMVIHDATVDRTTDGTGAVATKTAAELYSLDAGVRRAAEFAGEPVPTFESALELISATSLGLNIEIKRQPDEAAAVAEVVRLLRRFDKLDDYVISSFHLDILLAVRALAPTLGLALLGKVETVMPLALEHQLPWIHCGNPTLTRDHVVAARQQGLHVGVWTVNDPLRVAFWAGAGVERIITDNPRPMLAIDFPCAVESA